MLEMFWTPSWRLWPSIIFGTLGAFFLFFGVVDFLFEFILLGIAFLSMAVLSFWVLKPDMSNPAIKHGVGRRMLEKSRAPNQQRLDIPEPVRQMEEKKPD